MPTARSGIIDNYCNYNIVYHIFQKKSTLFLIFPNFMSIRAYMKDPAFSSSPPDPLYPAVVPPLVCGCIVSFLSALCMLYPFFVSGDPRLLPPVFFCILMGTARALIVFSGGKESGEKVYFYTSLLLLFSLPAFLTSVLFFPPSDGFSRYPDAFVAAAATVAVFRIPHSAAGYAEKKKTRHPLLLSTAAVEFFSASRSLHALSSSLFFRLMKNGYAASRLSMYSGAAVFGAMFFVSAFMLSKSREDRS